MANRFDVRTRLEVCMHTDLVVGGRFPDLELPDHRGDTLRLSTLAAGCALIVSFYRGYW
jgi:peroxiredoxin